MRSECTTGKVYLVLSIYNFAYTCYFITDKYDYPDSKGKENEKNLLENFAR